MVMVRAVKANKANMVKKTHQPGIETNANPNNQNTKQKGHNQILCKGARLMVPRG
jgi:hypothetical protein